MFEYFMKHCTVKVKDCQTTPKLQVAKLKNGYSPQYWKASSMKGKMSSNISMQLKKLHFILDSQQNYLHLGEVEKLTVLQQQQLQQQERQLLCTPVNTRGLFWNTALSQTEQANKVYPFKTGFPSPFSQTLGKICTQWDSISNSVKGVFLNTGYIQYETLSSVNCITCIV